MLIFTILDESVRVAWADLCYFKKNFLVVVISCLVGPLLYLLAFGYGLGGGMSGGSGSYIAFIIPGIISLTTLSSSFGSTSSKILIQRLFYMSFDELVLCPIHVSSIVIGKALMGTLRSVLSCIIILIIGMVISPAVSITPLVILYIIISSFTFALLGVLAGMLAKSNQALNLFNSLVIIPMTFLCGTLFNVSALPSIFGYIVYALPLTHSAECIRSASLGWDVPYVSIVILLAYCAVFFIADYHLIKKGSS